MNSTSQPTQPMLHKRKRAIRLILAIVGLVILLLGARWTIQTVSSHTLTNENAPLMLSPTPSATFPSTATAPARATNTSKPTATKTSTATATRTNTPTATRTMVPSSTPETLVRFSGEFTNLRAGPGTSFEVVRNLANGDMLRLLGRTSDNSWLYVKTIDGQEGWIRPTWVELEGINLDTYAVETPAVEKTLKVLGERVSLRTGPGDAYVKLLTFSFGDMVSVLGRMNDFSWLFVRTTGGQEGWINTAYIDPNAINIYNDFYPVKTPPPTETATLVVLPDVEGHWIDVDLSEQTLRAYDGTTLLKSFLVSTGVYEFPTRTGQYHIYAKFDKALMHGSDYYLPDVPWIMYYDGDYSIHGTYWHHNFGHPMSHGCINMDISDAGWMYEFAPVGTLVNIHH